MDVIIFAGGAGTRMRPLVAAPIPKHLIPVGDYPLIYHVLQTAVRGGASRLLLSLNGPHPELTNFLFMNGFSGHGLQQAPAMGRGIAEWLVHGRYRTLDLSPFHFERIMAGKPYVESAII
jgi:NDP-sugar pyrophosphorylase family protein